MEVFVLVGRYCKGVFVYGRREEKFKVREKERRGEGSVIEIIYS